MPTFSDIQEEIRNMLDIPDSDLDADQRKVLDAYLDELGSQEAAKVDSFSQFIKMENARAEAISEEAKRLSARARAAKNNIDRLKNHYVGVMLAHNLKKVSGNVYSLSMRKSEKVEAPETEEEIAALPEIYRRVKTTIEPDKTVIKEALKGGIEIPGCSLKENYSLQIR